MWIEMARELTPSCLFYPPVGAEDVAQAERTLGVALPESLRALLAETNGLDVRPASEDWSEPGDCLGFIYCLAELVRTNLALRSVPPAEAETLDTLLFFASAPNGDFFGFPVVAGQAQDRDIVCVSHEDNAGRELVVEPLQELLRTFLGHVKRLEAEAATPAV